MDYFPIFLRLKSQRCLVVGGGEVAAQKVALLLRAAAEVIVIAPVLCEELQSRVASDEIQHSTRSYSATDLEDMRLVYAATDDQPLNETVSYDAEKRGIPVNVVDQAELCRFISPALVEQGALTIAISTSGKSPALASKIRSELEAHFGAEYATLLELLGSLRNSKRAKAMGYDERKHAFQRLLDSPVLEWIQENEQGEVERMIERTFGAQDE